MRSIHRGRLQSLDDPSIDIPATLTFERDEIQIKSEGQVFGSWPLTDFSAERQEANEFNLVIGDEVWRFAAEDPALFMVTSMEILANQPKRGEWRKRIRNVGAAGITIGAFSLAVATTLTAFAGGVIVGRYQLDDNVAVLAVAGVVVVVLSLIRIRATRRLSPPPSVAARELERRPVPVARAVARRQSAPSPDEAPSVSLPGRLVKDDAEPKPPLELSRISPLGRDSQKAASSNARSSAEPGDESGTIEATPDSEDISPGTGDETAPGAINQMGTGPDGTMDVELAPIEETRDVDLDLSTIKGIGPALAGRLIDLGVHDVRDLANLDQEDVTLVVEYLGRFGKRIVTEDWVGQARRRLEVPG